MEKVSFQQALVKNKKKSTSNRIHGRGIMMTLPEEWYVLPEFSTLAGKEYDTSDLEKVRSNANQSIYSSVQYMRLERNDKVNGLPNLDYGKLASMRMLKTYWKGLRTGFSVYGMDRVEQFRVSGNCISDRLSIIKAGSVYLCRKKIL